MNDSARIYSFIKKRSKKFWRMDSGGLFTLHIYGRCFRVYSTYEFPLTPISLTKEINTKAVKLLE